MTIHGEPITAKKPKAVAAAGPGSARDDLAYIKAIAEEGRNTPLVGGRNFFVWGALIGTAALAVFLMETGAIPAFNQMILWSGALAIGWVLSFVINSRSSERPGASSLSNRTVNAAWLACGIFVTVYWLSIVAASLLVQEGGYPVRFLFATMFPVAFGLYGLAFFATAVVAHQPWYRWVSVVSWAIACALLLSLAVWPVAYMLVAAIGTYAVVLAPGYVMLRNEPSDIV
ncbi:hypothetical protein [Aquisalinus flavus]|uniref:Uncharacterized protein n=1 Tax=Aquisalinus flavus TaxID=1526572 RepID=A0A8J2V7K6_9PROT|nr:hypothetical protein [Aquisalinus flavus]MBD0426179.1 hypothetical protein [Aquisalinus flavus]UNE48246.1 hypothetical protein FF099_09365 [Aquisalinus flavus]GGD09952.1 hypothetical protein GCM10011342_18590 [Aquisalinus flavus]